MIAPCTRERSHDGPCNGMPCEEGRLSLIAEKRERLTLEILRGMLASGQRAPAVNMVASALEYADEVLRVFGA